jgi:hypothetical protein
MQNRFDILSQTDGSARLNALRKRMDRLRFLHIPKTGGVTLASILRHQYRGIPLFEFTGEIATDKERYFALPEEERKNIGLFLGHSHRMTGIPEADTASVITLLRDPIERVKSFCQHVYEGKSPHLLAEFPPDSFSLERFLESGYGELSNLQTRHLLESDDPESVLRVRSLSAREAQDMALDVLFHQTRLFGLVELFDESVIAFSSAFGWRMPFYRRNNVKNPNRILEFQPRHLERIAELNAIDSEVYAAARRRFLDTVHSRAFIRAGTCLFSRLNRAPSLLWRAYRRIL